MNANHEASLSEFTHRNMLVIKRWLSLLPHQSTSPRIWHKMYIHMHNTETMGQASWGMHFSGCLTCVVHMHSSNILICTHPTDTPQDVQVAWMNGSTLSVLTYATASPQSCSFWSGLSPWQLTWRSMCGLHPCCHHRGGRPLTTIFNMLSCLGI